MKNDTLTAVVLKALLDNDAKKATAYFSPKFTLKLTRIGKMDRRNRTHDFRLTFGSPNYAERQFIKQCLKAGEPFPVKKVQLKFYPKKKKAA